MVRAWLKCVGGPLLVSRSALTNDHKLGGLPQQTCLLLPLGRSLKLRCWQGLRWGSGGESCPAFSSSQKNVAFLACSCITPPLPDFLLCVCLRVSSLHMKTPVIVFRAYPNPVWPYLNQLHLQRPDFQARSYCEGPVGTILRGTYSKSTDIYSNALRGFGDS